MNLRELANVVRKEHGFNYSLSLRIVNTILAAVKKELTKGKRVRLRNFGTFEARISHGKRRAKFDDSNNFFK